ncbi:MAG: YicC family protein [Deltaproteobacteria bacterium]|nr:YicC family protein [Deltaproteobacteria bacterium]
MLQSMTGYGRASFAIGVNSYMLELKSLNNRFLDVNLRMPERFFPVDLKMRGELKKRFSRGSFTVFISSMPGEAPGLELNMRLAKAYVEAAGLLKETLGIDNNVDAGFLLRTKEIFAAPQEDNADEWTPLKAALETAFVQAEAWRIKEGESIALDMRYRLAHIEASVSKVEQAAPAAVEAYRARLKEDIERLIAGRAEEGRIMLEAAVFAQRSDISEEITRLKSHIALFRQYLALNEPIGKRLDFLCQEIGREINTIGSKSGSAQIAQIAVEMKNELEKIKEQTQNAE